jgi:hypothetical protein
MISGVAGGSFAGLAAPEVNMLLATIVLLCPFPQTGDVAIAVLNRSAAASRSTNASSSLSLPLPSMPDAKVRTDATAEADAMAMATPAALASADAIGPHYGPLPLEPAKPAFSRTYEKPAQKKMWYALAAAGHGAAAFDAWSTRRALSQNYGRESNPLLRPFAHSGLLYAATQVSPLVMDMIGKRMIKSQHKWVRRMWWLPQSAGLGASITAGVRNMSVVP